MAKKIADYRDHVEETMKAFDEDRVLLVSQRKEGIQGSDLFGLTEKMELKMMKRAWILPSTK